MRLFSLLPSTYSKKDALWRVRSAALAVLVYGLLAIVPLPAAAAAPATATAPATGVDPGAAALIEKLPELKSGVEAYRGLRFERPVPTKWISEEDLTRKLATGYRVGPNPGHGDVTEVEIALKAFGLLPPGTDLAEYLPTLMGSEIAGFYDSDAKELTLVTGPSSLFGEEARQHLGAQQAAALEALLVHELTHAVQDQHFGLDRLMPTANGLSDADQARLALVEGDATLTMFADLAALPPADLPAVAGVLQAVIADPQKALALVQSSNFSADLASAPAWIRETLLFSYLQGAYFCAKLLEHGGQRLLDYAFRTDPPRSTAQILHPEKWYGRRDDPPAIAWPDLAAEVPGFTKVASGQLGELGIGILLRQARAAPSPSAAAVAAGWEADQFAVYRQSPPAAGKAGSAGSASNAGRAAPQGRGGAANAEGSPGNEPTLLVWITDWDADADAARFAAAAAALGTDWLVERSAPRRVIVLRGTPAAAARAALLRKLAAAPAERAAAHGIDPSAIDPQRRVGAESSLVAARVAAKRQAMLPTAAVSATQLSDDRATYTFPGFGLALHLPADLTHWSTMAPPTPAIVLQLVDPRQAASLSISVVDLQQPIASLELLEPILEQGMKAIPGFARLDGHLVEGAGYSAYDLRFTSSPNGADMLVESRVIAHGSQLVTISMGARKDRWADIEPLAKELFASITLSPLPATPPAKSAAPTTPPPPTH